MATLSFKLTEALYLRDPQSTELGQRILKTSIILIDKLGFEQFTFKKLADEIDSTEASIYRYFENKHRLLLYLIDWYWAWIGYRIDFETNNIADPRERLSICLRVLTEEKNEDLYSADLDGKALHRIVMAEFEKTYLTKQVDNDNREGLFLPYKQVCRKVSDIVRQINPSFPYPMSLVSTLMLSVNHQLFYAEHLPSLTDIRYEPRQHFQKLNDFVNLLVTKALQP
ncbi:MAG: TetR/AcrR family transcriptional regulator [Cyclobacteriaceae bacterium]|nr:TetR/AcrR family transcriptional regulator [Cyclobacteriaceae bacterium]